MRIYKNSSVSQNIEIACIEILRYFAIKTKHLSINFDVFCDIFRYFDVYMRDFTKSVEKHDIDIYRYCKNFFRYIEISRIKIGRIKISRKLSVDFFDPQREFWMSFLSRLPLCGPGTGTWCIDSHSSCYLRTSWCVRATMFQVHFARPARHIHLHTIVYLSHHPWHAHTTSEDDVCLVFECFVECVAGSMTWTRLCKRQSVLSQRKQVCASKVCDERTTPCSNRHRTSEHEKRCLVFQYIYRKSLSFCDKCKSCGICDIYRNATELLRYFFMIAIFFLCFCDIFFNVSSVCDKYRKINWLLFIAKYRNFR